MGDLRQAAIDEWKNDFKGYINALDIPKDDYKGIMEYINELPSAQPGWIPTSERLPDVRQWVLCQCRAGIMDVLRLTADGSWNKDYPHTDYMSGFVVAWQPLPKPYREGGQDE